MKKPSSKQPQQASASRRTFLTRAAATTGAALGALPLLAKAQQKPAAPAVVSSTGPVSMRWQSTWPAKDIFHEYALDFAKKVNDMTGGDLRIEVLPAGAVVPAVSPDSGSKAADTKPNSMMSTPMQPMTEMPTIAAALGERCRVPSNTRPSKP